MNTTISNPSRIVNKPSIFKGELMSRFIIVFFLILSNISPQYNIKVSQQLTDLTVTVSSDVSSIKTISIPRGEKDWLLSYLST
nr:hypothetical protein [Sphingobacterium sp. HMA12]